VQGDKLTIIGHLSSLRSGTINITAIAGIAEYSICAPPTTPTAISDIGELRLEDLGAATTSQAEALATFTAGEDGTTLLLILAAIAIGFWVFPMIREFIAWHD
jgi:hypothetical protein